MTPAVHRSFALLATVVVVASVAWGFMIVGSPDRRRAQRLDERRLDALQVIQQEIHELVRDPDDHTRLKHPLPRTLDELVERARRRKLDPEDPETGVSYTYRILSETTYELCATFTHARDEDWDVFWNHPAGRQCFTIDALDPP